MEPRQRARRATFLADLDGGGPVAGAQRCEGCGRSLDLRAAWIVSVTVAEDGVGDVDVVLCDDCTEQRWAATWTEDDEDEDEDGHPARPVLRLVANP